MAEPHHRLKEAREARGYSSASDAARAFGWAISTYSGHENGSRGIKPKAAASYARALGVSAGWLLTGEGKQGFAGVPLVGYVGAGAEVLPVDGGARELDRVAAPPGCPDDAVALKVKGDSMYPAYRDGDIIIYAERLENDPSAIREQLLGQECVLQLVDGASFVKTIEAGADAETFTLTSYNASPIRDARIWWAARVMWVRRG